MMCGEEASRPVRKKSVCFFLIIALLFFILPGNARPQEATAKDFLGPVPGTALVYESPDGFGPERVIGMEVDSNGIYRIIQEIPLPPNTMPDPLHPKQFLSKGYFQQLLFADGCHIVLKGWKVNTVILDISKETWTSAVTLQVACPENVPQAKDCPEFIITTAQFRIVSKTTQRLLGEQRTVLTVHSEVRTREYGTRGSTSYIFVSGLGMFNGSLPENLRIEKMTEEELAALDRHITDLRRAFGETQH
jgi:hypothetical protein